MRKIIVFVLVGFVLVLAFQQETRDRLRSFIDPTNEAIFVSTDGGNVRYVKNAYRPQPIASLTKVLVAYEVWNRVATGRASWDDTITIPQAVLDQITIPNSATGLLYAGETYTLRELTDLMLIASANDATIAIAYMLEGNEHLFVERLEARAKSLGFDSFRLYNATGLPTEDGMENEATAEELGKLTIALAKDYPTVFETTSRPFVMSKNGTKLLATNALIPGRDFAYEGVNGLKTGYTEQSGHSVIVTGENDGTSYVIVLLHEEDEEEKFRKARELIETYTK